MAGVKFITMNMLDRKATGIVAEVENGKVQIAITQKGVPVALLQAVRGKVSGRMETVSNLKNHSSRIIAELVKTGEPIVITRDAEPVAILLRITENAFRVR